MHDCNDVQQPPVDGARAAPLPQSSPTKRLPIGSPELQARSGSTIHTSLRAFYSHQVNNKLTLNNHFQNK